jgi:hypothetical protein
MSGIPTVGTDLVFPCEGPNTTAYGLTKRELFAAMAMQGLIASPRTKAIDPASIAKWAVNQADAMLSALAGAEQP